MDVSIISKQMKNCLPLFEVSETGLSDIYLFQGENPGVYAVTRTAFWLPARHSLATGRESDNSSTVYRR